MKKIQLQVFMILFDDLYHLIIIFCVKFESHVIYTTLRFYN